MPKIMPLRKRRQISSPVEYNSGEINQNGDDNFDIRTDENKKAKIKRGHSSTAISTTVTSVKAIPQGSQNEFEDNTKKPKLDIATPSFNSHQNNTQPSMQTTKHINSTLASTGAPAAPAPLSAAAISKTSSFVNDRTIYIEGLPFNSNDDEVKSFFSECGKILSVRLPKWHDSGRLRGYGHVEFASKESAAKAFDLDGCDFLSTGRFVKVAKPMVPRAAQALDQPQSKPLSRPVGCKTVFVKNLPYTATEAQIRETFQVCGPITTVRLATWVHTQTPKGFGYIEFKREDSAEIAVKKSGKLTLDDRALIVDFETGAPKGSYKNPLAAATHLNGKSKIK